MRTEKEISKELQRGKRWLKAYKENKLPEAINNVQIKIETLKWVLDEAGGRDEN